MIFSTIEFLFYFFPLLIAVYFATSLKERWMTAAAYVALAAVGFVTLMPYEALPTLALFLGGVLIILLAGLFIFPSLRFKNLILLSFSLFFYLWGGGWQLTLVMVGSIIGNFVFGHLIAAEHIKGTMKKLNVAAGVAVLLGGFVTLAHFAGFGESLDNDLAGGIVAAWPAFAFTAVMLAGCVVIRQVWGGDVHSRRKAYAWWGFIFNIAILGYFKYMNFFVEQINPLLTAMKFGGFELAYIALPIGISFYTFQSISYLLDIYDGEAKAQKNLTDFGLYVSLFPQLIAGPIVRYQLVADQITNRQHTFDDFTMGASRFCWGLAKKVLIADQVGMIVEAIYGMEPGNLTTQTAWLGALAYTMQIYFDFSGYSDMAIGLGRMFGFRFPENFTRPYSALSITDFWRRWHMTLSYWFRDYLYIRMGGSRVPVFWTYFNLALVFFVTGLWHGAAWAFLIWGAYHGIILVIERVTGQRPTKETKSAFIRRPLIFFLALVGWVIFRAGSLDLVPADMRDVTGLEFAWAMYTEMFTFDFSDGLAVEAALSLTSMNMWILALSCLVVFLPRDYFFGQMLETRGGLWPGLIGLVGITAVGLFFLPSFLYLAPSEPAIIARWVMRAIVAALAGLALYNLSRDRTPDGEGVAVLWSVNRLLVVGVLASFAMLQVISGTFTAFLYYQF